MIEVILILIIVIGFIIVLSRDTTFTATRPDPDTLPPEGRYDLKI